MQPFFMGKAACTNICEGPRPNSEPPPQCKKRIYEKKGRPSRRPSGGGREAGEVERAGKGEKGCALSWGGCKNEKNGAGKGIFLRRLRAKADLEGRGTLPTKTTRGYQYQCIGARKIHQPGKTQPYDQRSGRKEPVRNKENLQSGGKHQR